MPGSPTWHGGSTWVQPRSAASGFTYWRQSTSRSKNALAQSDKYEEFGVRSWKGALLGGEWGWSERAGGLAGDLVSFGGASIPARMTSTPAGCQRSPGLSSSSTELLGRVRKYSPSSTCVPSDSSSSRTGSPGGTFNFSLPATKAHAHSHSIYTPVPSAIDPRAHSLTLTHTLGVGGGGLRSLQNFRVRLANNVCHAECVRRFFSQT